MVRDSIVPKLRAVLVIGYMNEWSIPKTKTPYVNQETKGKDEFLFQLTNAVNNNYTITVDKGSIFYYRGDSASMKPKIVFEKDILPKGKHDDLFKHIRGQRENFVSTSSDFDISDSFAEKNGYNYIIDTDRGINTVKFFGERHPFPEQKEFSIPNGIKIRK